MCGKWWEDRRSAGNPDFRSKKKHTLQYSVDAPPLTKAKPALRLVKAMEFAIKRPSGLMTPSNVL